MPFAPASKLNPIATFLIPVFRRRLRRLAGRLSSDSAITRLREPQTRIVWHVAAPKSGSTWVSKVLSEGLAERGWSSSMLYTTGRAVRREQTLDLRALFDLKHPHGPVFATHQHCPYSEYARSFIEEHDVRVILQVRDLFDCLVSFVDHLDNNPLVPMAFMTREQWGALDHAQRCRFVTDLVAPWYIRFWAGWYQAWRESGLDIRLVRYEALCAEPARTFQDLTEFCTGQAADLREVKRWMEAYGREGTRLNRGVSGRGRDWPEAHRQRIRSWVELYPETDFSPLGL
ncbi:MAG: hypothetical protein GVY24_06665 [Planctomycetes bacterium]|jgi:hypothetical protein|nr:hypothetical protein [Planctomycetota bacterium]